MLDVITTILEIIGAVIVVVAVFAWNPTVGLALVGVLTSATGYLMARKYGTT